MAVARSATLLPIEDHDLVYWDRITSNAFVFFSDCFLLVLIGSISIVSTATLSLIECPVVDESYEWSGIFVFLEV